MKTIWKSLFAVAFLEATRPVLHAEIGIEAGPNLNTARIAHQVARLSDGRVVVFGGHGPGFVSLGSAEIWSGTSNVFSALPMASPHDTAAFTRLSDGRFLIAGGSADWGIPAYSASEVFDPTTGAFAATGPMVRFRSTAGACALKGGKALIAGGWWTHNDAHTYGELFDPTSGSFVATGPLNVPRANPVVLPTEDGNAVVVGGMGYTGASMSASPELFNLDDKSFTLLGAELFADDPGWQLTALRESIETARMADGRYLLLATKAQGGYALCTFDPVTKTFAKFATTPALPGAQTDWLWSPMLNAARNKAVLLGFVPGASPAKVNLHKVDLLTGALTSQSVPGEFPNSYSLASASQCLVDDQRVLLIGGTTGDNFGALPYTVFIKIGGEASLQVAMYAGIQIVGEVGRKYQIEYTDQAGGEWSPLVWFELVYSPYVYFDPTSKVSQKRIYRAVLLP